MECRIQLGGPAGGGLQTVEGECTGGLARLGFHFFAARRYQSRIRGGLNLHDIRIADHPVHALPGGVRDVVVALDGEAARRQRPVLREDGIFLGPEDLAALEELGRRVFQDPRARNGIVAGALFAVLGCEKTALVQAAGDAAAGRAFAAGYDWAEQQGWRGRFPVAPRAGHVRPINGSQALAYGALLGGCQFAAGYPMTPATGILNALALAAAHLPVHFEQAEDEIAAINMALGASYAGLRSLVATSGGGFALMQEGVSLAAMTETPVVVLVGQRPGPATGLPTRTEQGDLGLVCHAGHGEFPRAIFAPGTIEEALELMPLAFDLADRYQIPVFVLSDQAFADGVHAVTTDIPCNVRQRSRALFEGAYRRYALAEDGVSPQAFPGLGPAAVRADSDEHDEDGRITEDPALRRRMVDKRLKKFAALRREARMPAVFGSPDAPVQVLCWGSTRPVVEEAVAALRKDGQVLGGLHFPQVYPLTPDMVAGLSGKDRAAICIEHNATGQFAALLLQETGFACGRHIRKYDGEVFSVEELCRNITDILEVQP